MQLQSSNQHMMMKKKTSLWYAKWWGNPSRIIENELEIRLTVKERLWTGQSSGHGIVKMAAASARKRLIRPENGPVFFNINSRRFLTIRNVYSSSSFAVINLHSKTLIPSKENRHSGLGECQLQPMIYLLINFSIDLFNWLLFHSISRCPPRLLKSCKWIFSTWIQSMTSQFEKY